MVHNIPRELQSAAIEKAIEKILKGEPDIIYNANEVIGMDKKHTRFYTAYMKTLAKKANQDLYTKFTLEKGINFIPAYVDYNVSQKTMSVKIRGDFLKKRLQSELDFVSWLRSKKSSGLVKHRLRKAKQYEHWETHIGDYKQKPHWIKEARKIWISQGYFDKKVNKDKKFSDKIGINVMGSQYSYEDTWRINEDNEVVKQKQAFTQPIDNENLKRLLDPNTSDDLFGDKKTQQYLKKYKINQKLYNKIMKEVLTKLWKSFEMIDARILTEESSKEVDYDGDVGTFNPKFPNIVRVRDWFINKGILNTKKHHQFTLENFMKLKSNTARSNFIDRAVFVISNSIYAKMNGEQTSKITSNPYSPTPFRKGLTSGKKIPISKARQYKKQSKSRDKYKTERTKNYTEWKLDNRKLSANLKRKTTRKDNRSRR